MEVVVKKTWIIAAAGAFAVAVIGAGVVMAQTPAGSSGPSFLDRVAQKLGIDTPKLKDAITGARQDQIDEAVQNGDLTQKQADALKSRADRLPDGAFGFGGPGMHGKRGPGGPGMGGPFGFGMGLENAGQKFAEYLGISTDTLKTELSAEGATLAKVAEAHGKSRGDLTSFIADNATALLDAKVKDGDLTQKREDEMLSQLNAHIDNLIDHPMPHFGMGGHHRFGGPGPGGAPQAPHQSGTMGDLFRS
jgi:polyhydroxyalkanoate synthesis regulator phasin